MEISFFTYLSCVMHGIQAILMFSAARYFPWQSEQYHRAINQVCHIERFQVRGKVAVKNHIFAAIEVTAYARN